LDQGGCLKDDEHLHVYLRNAGRIARLLERVGILWPLLVRTVPRIANSPCSNVVILMMIRMILMMPMILMKVVMMVTVMMVTVMVTVVAAAAAVVAVVAVVVVGGGGDEDDKVCICGPTRAARTLAQEQRIARGDPARFNGANFHLPPDTPF